MKGAFVFAGNRFNVLEEMIASNLCIVKILVVKNSYLEKILLDKQMPFSIIENKESLVRILESLEFNYFISNGLPFILPSELLLNTTKKYINIHPSYLPDMRGADPIPGAILFERDSGATCHEIDSGIDTGNIISQIKFPYNDKWDALSLYQISFFLEKEVFCSALKKEFKASLKQDEKGNYIYYSFKKGDLLINFKDGPKKTYNKIKAFNNASKGAEFIFNNKLFKVFDVDLISVPHELLGKIDNGCVIYKVENQIGLLLDYTVIVLKKVIGDLNEVYIGANLLKNGN